MDTDELQRSVEASQLGDEAAFALLVDAYYPVVHAICVGATGNWTTAEDLSQEVFVAAWKNLNRIQNPKAFPIWLRRIARNASTDWIRRQQAWRVAKEKSERDPISPHAGVDDPATTAARNELSARMSGALRALSPKLREAVCMYYLEGRSTAESASALGITIEAMKKRLKLGRAALRREYAEIESLEPLLPYSPAPQRGRILAGLAAGPAMISMENVGGTRGNELLGDHLRSGGSISALREAGLMPSAARLLITSALVAVIGAGVVATALQSTESNVAVEERTYIGIGAYSTDEDDPEIGAHTYVHEVFPGYAADVAGLRAGDRVVLVNGVRLEDARARSDAHWMRGEESEPMQMVVVRESADGVEEMEIEIAPVKVPMRLYEAARERAEESE